METDTEISGAERRRESRIPTRLSVMVRLDEPDAEQFPAVLADCSESGCRLVINRADERHFAGFDEREETERVVVLLPMEVRAQVVIPTLPPVERRSHPVLRREPGHWGYAVGLRIIDRSHPGWDSFRQEARSTAAGPPRLPGRKRARQGEEAVVIRELLAEHGSSAPLRNILVRMIRRGGANRIYRTLHAQDGGDGGAGRSRGHALAVRIHFLRDERLDAQDGAGDADSRSVIYLGYVEVLPGVLKAPDSEDRLAHVGRSVIPYPEAILAAEDAQLASGHRSFGRGVDGVPYFIMQARYQGWLWERETECWTIQFEQQAIRDGSCAHAAVAMSTGFQSRLSRRHGLSQRDITAHHSFGPGDDLTEKEVAEAFRRSGARPRIYYGPNFVYRNQEFPALIASGVVSQRELLDLAHLAADSYLPAVLNLVPSSPRAPRHAVLLVGHTTLAPGQPAGRPLLGGPEDPVGPASGTGQVGPERKRIRQPLTTTLWIRDLLVHDDARGPFLRIPVDDDRRETAGAAIDPDRTFAWDVESIVIPFPRSVRFDPRYVIRHVHSLLTDTFAAPPWNSGGRPLSSRQTPRLTELAAAWNDSPTDDVKDVVTGVYLDHGERFRQGMCAAIAGRPDAAKELRLLRSIVLPNYVWVASVMLRTECERGPDAETGVGGTLGARIHGYALIDATRHQFSERVTLLLRLGEFCQFLDPDAGMSVQEWMPFPERRQPGTLGHERRPTPASPAP